MKIGNIIVHGYLFGLHLNMNIYIYFGGGGGGVCINKLIIIWALADLRSMHKSILVYLSKKMEKEKYFGKIDVITWLSCISNNNI